MMEKYLAKSSNGEEVENKKHLEDAAELAKSYGEAFEQGDTAECAGKLHDFGKYSAKFQQVLKGTATGIDHAFCGAAYLIGRKFVKNAAQIAITEAINGHHDGLKALEYIKPYAQESLLTTNEIRCNAGKTAALAGMEEYKKADAAFKHDFPEFKPKCSPLPVDDSNLSKMLYTRMIFSCLVDADYSASAKIDNPEYLDTYDCDSINAEKMLEKLEALRNEIKRNSTSDKELNRLRDMLYEQCGEAGKSKDSLFTLTAPTGTGKTLALLKFALEHCKENHKRRIIIVLPFLTLAEQSADKYREICPELFEDHSQRELDDTAREFASRWSSPFILTTSVKFFESLFASKPTDCRKLHNIANSVIVFDEAQSLPSELAVPTLQVVNELCKNYKCTFVFSTATQPDFDALAQLSWKPTEIMPQYRRLYDALRRTSVEWRVKTKTPLEKLAGEMSRYDNVCAIVNLRAHARELYRAVKDLCSDDSVFFMTTDLCPAHRRRIVEEIKERQKNKLPCVVVSTQCIEAGVDLDFDYMYRSLAPLEAIIQAAGRCNRNGSSENGTGKVVVFVPDSEKQYPGNSYGNAAELVKVMLSRAEIDINNPDCISEYYRLLFKDNREKHELSEAVKVKSYENVNREYKLIQNNGRKVIVPYTEYMEKYESIVSEIREKGITPKLMREAASITVTTFDVKQLEACAEKVFFRKRTEGQKIESDYFILPVTCKNYSNDMGLQFSSFEPEDLFV